VPQIFRNHQRTDAVAPRPARGGDARGWVSPRRRTEGRSLNESFHGDRVRLRVESLAVEFVAVNGFAKKPGKYTTRCFEVARDSLSRARIIDLHSEQTSVFAEFLGVDSSGDEFHEDEDAAQTRKGCDIARVHLAQVSFPSFSPREIRKALLGSESFHESSRGQTDRLSDLPEGE
jgi:hypothetical protein